MPGNGPSIVTGPPLAPSSDVTRLWPLLVVTGAALIVPGWVDVALFWYPPRLGEADWEFAIIAQTLDAMPLPTMGLALVALGLLARGSGRTALRLAAIVAALVAVKLVGMAVLFVLATPQALTAARNPELGPGIRRALLKSALFLLSYTAAYLAAAVILWRASGRAAGARRRRHGED